MVRDYILLRDIDMICLHFKLIFTSNFKTSKPIQNTRMIVHKSSPSVITNHKAESE